MSNIVKVKLHCSTLEVDTLASKSDMRNQCPMFFKNSHGKRETFTIHKGCIIVRNTIQFTCCKPERHTTVYLYGKLEDGQYNMFCISSLVDLKNVAQAKRLIDNALNEEKIPTT